MSPLADNVNAQATSEDFEFAALREARNYRRSLVSEFSPHLRGHVLEVGAGIGQMTHELASLPGIQAFDALEPDARFFQQLQKLEPGIRCIRGTVADLDPAPVYDGVVAVNVLEHIEDHFEELRRIRQRMKSGGRLCLFVPAFQAIYAPIDRSFGHFRRYSRGELRALLKKAGFRIIDLHYYNSLGFFAWWLNFCVLKKSVFEPEKVRFYDRFLFPVVHGLETKVMRPPLGQSVLVVAEA